MLLLLLLGSSPAFLFERALVLQGGGALGVGNSGNLTIDHARPRTHINIGLAHIRIRGGVAHNRLHDALSDKLRRVIGVLNQRGDLRRIRDVAILRKGRANLGTSLKSRVIKGYETRKTINITEHTLCNGHVVVAKCVIHCTQQPSIGASCRHLKGNKNESQC